MLSLVHLYLTQIQNWQLLGWLMGPWYTSYLHLPLILHVYLNLTIFTLPCSPCLVHLALLPTPAFTTHLHDYCTLSCYTHPPSNTLPFLLLLPFLLSRQERLEQLADKFSRKASLRKLWLGDMSSVLDKLDRGQDVHAVDAALKRHEAISTEVNAGVSRGCVCVCVCVF